MRVDKFLKVSRIIKRRTVAGDACAAGRIVANGKAGKPSYQVTPGAVLEIAFGDRILKVEVLTVAEHASKDEAASLYREL